MTGQPCAFVQFSGSSPSRRSMFSLGVPTRLGRIPASPVFSTSLIDGAETFSVEAGTVFEPIMPSAESLVGFGIIVILCVVVSNVWAEQVVPVSRTKLAISKRRGEIKEYLDELKASDSSLLNSTDIDLFRAATNNATDTNVPVSSKAAKKDSRSFERWLFTDWLLDNKSERKSGRQKEPALPILKDAKWNSGDNPVLAASALLGAGVLFSAIAERFSSINFNF